MLQRTFVHIPGVGPVRERRFWAAGLRTWSDCLECGGRPADAVPGLREHVARSREAFRQGAWGFFEERLPADQKWRVFGDFADRALCLDIETTGLGEQDAITMIGVYDGREVRTYVAGLNLDAAAADIARYPLLVTYNGALFDLPRIRRRFPGLGPNHIHVDLRYPLRRLGYRGGLKRIEDRLGIVRSAETRGLDGWDAVRLWQAYQAGSRAALDLLIAYNAEDVRHLRPMMEFAYRALAARLEAGPRCAPPPG